MPSVKTLPVTGLSSFVVAAFELATGASLTAVIVNAKVPTSDPPFASLAVKSMAGTVPL